MRSDKIKKEMRRVAVFSLCCVVLCVACLVSATFAYFEVSVTNEGNVISVAEFEATNTITVGGNTTLGLTGAQGTVDIIAGNTAGLNGIPGLSDDEEPVEIHDGICEKGKYALNISWSGSADGYFAVHITSLELDSETDDLTYIISLPATGEEESSDIVVPLTLHEAAYVTTESSWGTPEGAVTLEELAQDERAITFGKQFDVWTFVDGEPVGEIGDGFAVGEHELYLYWESEVDGYCLIEVAPNDSDSETGTNQYIIKLPRTDVMDEGYGELLIPLTFHEGARVTAVVRKGVAEEAIDPEYMTDIEFGEPVIDWAVTGKKTSDGKYPAGEYTLAVDWQGVFSYLIIAVGDESYYMPVSDVIGSSEIELTLHTAASVDVVYGNKKTEMTKIEDFWIIYGEPTLEVTIGDEKLDSGALYPVGEYTMNAAWEGVFNYIVITLTGEDDVETAYYLSCGSTKGTVSVPLTLNAAAKVTVAYGWKVTGEMTEIGADGIVYGAAEEPTADEEPADGGETPAEGETPADPGIEEPVDDTPGEGSGGDSGSDEGSEGDTGSGAEP